MRIAPILGVLRQEAIYAEIGLESLCLEWVRGVAGRELIKCLPAVLNLYRLKEGKGMKQLCCY